MYFFGKSLVLDRNQIRQECMNILSFCNVYHVCMCIFPTFTYLKDVLISRKYINENLELEVCSQRFYLATCLFAARFIFHLSFDLLCMLSVRLNLIVLSFSTASSSKLLFKLVLSELTNSPIGADDPKLTGSL